MILPAVMELLFETLFKSLKELLDLHTCILWDVTMRYNQRFFTTQKCPLLFLTQKDKTLVLASIRRENPSLLLSLGWEKNADISCYWYAVSSVPEATFPPRRTLQFSLVWHTWER